MNRRRLIIGDVHGRFNALRQVLERAHFTDGEDILYSVGDFCDRGRDNIRVLRYLSSLASFRPVLGNHDAWLQDYLRTGCVMSDNWYCRNGGKTTVASFEGISKEERKRLSLWLDSIPYCRIEKGIIIIHGGPIGRNLRELERPRNYVRESDAKEIPDELWDRTYLRTAFLYEHWLLSEEKKCGIKFDEYCIGMKGQYDELGDKIRTGRLYIASRTRTIFTGHSIVGDTPFSSKTFHITAIDTGAASPDGRLTCMDMDSGEYWQSDTIRETEEN